MRNTILIIVSFFLLFSCNGKKRRNNSITLDSKLVNVIPSDKSNLNSIGLVRIDSSDNFYIYDKYDVTIKKYDSSGNYLYSIGRSGKGPGEFEVCRHFEISSEGNIVTCDEYNARFTIFDNNGQVVKTIPFKRKAINFRILQNGNYVIETIQLLYKQRSYTQKRILSLYDKKFDLIKNIDSTSYLSRKKIKGLLISYPFKNRMHWAVSNNKIIVAFEQGYVLKLYDLGGSQRSIIENYFKREKVRSSDKIKYFTGYRYRDNNKGWITGASEFIKKQIKFPKHLPTFINMYITSNGRLLFKLYGGKFIIGSVTNNIKEEVTFADNIDNRNIVFYKNRYFSPIENENGAVLKVYNYNIH